MKKISSKKNRIINNNYICNLYLIGAAPDERITLMTLIMGTPPAPERGASYSV